jgi:hypothetical protein
MENPTWLEAGPGRNWHSPTRSAKVDSSSERRRKHEPIAKIANMRDRLAETAHPKLEED